MERGAVGAMRPLRGLWSAVRLPLAVACLLGGITGITLPVWSGWWTANVQAREAAAFAARMATLRVAPAVILPTAVLPGTAPVSAQPSAQPAPPAPGGALAELLIPAIGVDTLVQEGLTYDADVWTRLLRDGPAHVAGSALPGQAGNVVIFGHLNIWGSVFFHLHQVTAGETIALIDPSGRFTYAVTGSRTIAATDLGAVAPRHTGPATLQLVTCEGAHEADRLVVEARLTAKAAPSAP